MKPGTTILPVASITCAPPRASVFPAKSSPMAKMRSPEMRISFRPSAAGATTSPPWITVKGLSSVMRRTPEYDRATVSQGPSTGGVPRLAARTPRRRRGPPDDLDDGEDEDRDEDEQRRDGGERGIDLVADALPHALGERRRGRPAEEDRQHDLVERDQEGEGRPRDHRGQHGGERHMPERPQIAGAQA